jgi:hypothetical protein
MLSAVLSAPPRQRLSLPGWETEVEEVVERLALRHLPRARECRRRVLRAHRGPAYPVPSAI